MKDLSEINLPIENEFGSQTSVLEEVHLLIKPHIVHQNGSTGVCARADTPLQDFCSQRSCFELDAR